MLLEKLYFLMISAGFQIGTYTTVKKNSQDTNFVTILRVRTEQNRTRFSRNHRSPYSYKGSKKFIYLKKGSTAIQTYINSKNNEKNTFICYLLLRIYKYNANHTCIVPVYRYTMPFTDQAEFCVHSSPHFDLYSILHNLFVSAG